MTAIVGDESIARGLAALSTKQFSFSVRSPEVLAEPGDFPAGHLYFDVDLSDRAIVSALRRKMSRTRPVGRRIFGVPSRRRSGAVQASTLGATDVIDLPLELTVLAQELANIVCATSVQWSEAQDGAAADIRQAAQQAETSLRGLFAFARGEAPADIEHIDNSAAEISAAVSRHGLAPWIESVNRYHRGTYRHCLLVTGLASAFALRLGFTRSDISRVTVGGLLHDLGKAAIPLSILDKPSALTADEQAIVRRHPIIGYDLLKAVPDLDADVLDVVRHHHEYLDGSGYPDRLVADQISDLVRICTIADVFGALIEPREYKPAMSNEAAYDGLLRMKGKLELALIRAFHPVAMAARGS